jgi:uncharacterized membrane protein YjdF
MQLGMVAVAMGGIVTANYTWLPAALVSLLASTVPTFLRRDLRVVLPAEINFLIVLALFLHVVGGYSGFYDKLPGWDHLTHAMSASLVATLGFVVVVALDKYVDSIFLPPLFLAFFIVMFAMSVGVVWELMEYAIDQLTGSMLQYSLNDSMIDLLFDSFGGLMVAIAGTYYLRHTTQEHFVESLQLDEAKGRIDRAIRKRRWPHR